MSGPSPSGTAQVALNCDWPERRNSYDNVEISCRLLSCMFRVPTKACLHTKMSSHYEMSLVVSDYIANVVLL